MPFAALEDETGKRLVESHSILTMPSASAVPILRRPQSVVPDRSSSVFAPFPAELRGTLEEATAVKAETNASRSFIGSRATEAQLREALQTGGNVHVASHAVLNHTNPMFSRIELSPGKTQAPQDDGYLDVHEILRMSVRSDLVYLSGCETGAGAAWSTAFRRTQDYATLSQAILYAGAQDVIATLWRIDDIGASTFARNFYAALANNDAVDALAIAQRTMIRDRKYASPRYWAAYTISGSGGSKPRAQKLRSPSVQ
jgi:CHAT domain-containing protein